MQRLVLAVLFLAAIAALIAVALSAWGRVSEAASDGTMMAKGGPVQKISFFLLLCLMIYVSMAGAS